MSPRREPKTGPDPFLEEDIPDPPPRPVLSKTAKRVVLMLAFSGASDANELADFVEQTATRGRPRKLDPDAAGPVYLRALRESGKVEAAVATVAAEFAVSREYVYRLKKQERWGGKR